MIEKIACTACDWRGTRDELTFPPHVLDDDYPDYGGDCPKCGANALSGAIVDFDEYFDMRVNELISNERVHREAYERRV